MKKYFIKSNINGKFLSHLFEDEHKQMFRADKPYSNLAYFYYTKAVAERIAKELNGTIHPIPEEK